MTKDQRDEYLRGLNDAELAALRTLNDSIRAKNGCGQLTCCFTASVRDCACYVQAEAIEKPIRAAIAAIREACKAEPDSEDSQRLDKLARINSSIFQPFTPHGLPQTAFVVHNGCVCPGDATIHCQNPCCPRKAPQTFGTSP